MARRLADIRVDWVIGSQVDNRQSAHPQLLSRPATHTRQTSEQPRGGAAEHVARDQKQGPTGALTVGCGRTPSDVREDGTGGRCFWTGAAPAPPFRAAERSRGDLPQNGEEHPGLLRRARATEEQLAGDTSIGREGADSLTALLAIQGSAVARSRRVITRTTSSSRVRGSSSAHVGGAFDTSCVTCSSFRPSTSFG